MTGIALVLLVVLTAELMINGGFSPLSDLLKASSGELRLIPGNS